MSGKTHQILTVKTREWLYMSKIAQILFSENISDIVWWDRDCNHLVFPKIKMSLKELFTWHMGHQVCFNTWVHQICMDDHHVFSPKKNVSPPDKTRVWVKGKPQILAVHPKKIGLLNDLTIGYHSYPYPFDLFRTSISPVSQWTHPSQKSRRPRGFLADNQRVSFTAMENHSDSMFFVVKKTVRTTSKKMGMSPTIWWFFAIFKGGYHHNRIS